MSSETTKQVPIIILVEDEDQQRDALIMLFEVEGYNVIGVPSAEEALNKIQEITPQMFVTDIKLTGMDGFSFYNEVRKNPKLQKVPFIFISAYNDEKAIQNVKNLGAVGYLTKPYNLEDLLKTVKQHI